MNTPFHLPLAIFGLGAPELLGILAVLLLLFGGSKLPALARGLGQSIKEFKKASKEGEEEETKSSPAPKAAQPATTTTATKPDSQP